MGSVQVVNIADASDGTGATPTGNQHVRNDQYFLEKIAERHAKEQGQYRPGVTYRLSHLPAGYGGYEKARDNSKHVDRYLYGHPNGIFRSLNELYPHFKHLQQFGGSVGCECKLCTGTGKGASKKSGSNSISSISPSEKSGYFAQGPSASKPPASKPPPAKPTFRPKVGTFGKQNPIGLPQGRLESDPPTPPRGKIQVDEEGTPDNYRALIDRLKEAGPEEEIDEDIIEQLSPDWRAGNAMLQELLNDWKRQPNWIPRLGEVVIFARNVSNEGIAWDNNSQLLRRTDRESRSWLDRPKWEAGVVTQMPVEEVSSEDLSGVPEGKKQNVTYSGFRIEPLSEPANQSKPFTSQHKYVHLHAIRPFCFWMESVHGLQREEWHPTIDHALKIASTFCLIGKYRFKGAWPQATVFASGMYLGPELILVNDAVRLTPSDPTKRSVSDVMVVSSIRLRFVDLDRSNDNDYDGGQPYGVCLHVSGKTFTLDPKRSFGGIAKAPVKLGEPGFPAGIRAYGHQWYHVTDPADPKAKLEVPYPRILGRAYDETAVKAWFTTPEDMPPPSSFQAVNATPAGKAKAVDISSGLLAMQQARTYSTKNDPRVNRDMGKAWYWADSRIEQLDLHEVNGRFVGTKEEARTKNQMNAWRQALKAMDGKRGGLEEYHAARKQRQEEEKKRESAQVPSSAWGMMASAAKPDSTDAEVGESGSGEGEGEAQAEGTQEEMELDRDEDGAQSKPLPSQVIDLSAELDDDEMYG